MKAEAALALVWDARDAFRVYPPAAVDAAPDPGGQGPADALPGRGRSAGKGHHARLGGARHRPNTVVARHGMGRSGPMWSARIAMLRRAGYHGRRSWVTTPL